ncbi:MAG: glycosyltransferase [Lachnospiraceae bacterium]|jgi:glycosyltransferase involved in cell wall biosynthesis|nr:glycosyltransferase [Lachnospiraceae bacterium]MDD5848177.1 glycosyltransferase [Bacillota bacterium]MCH4028152.1 glycosyltransferase [Lachnospiraceae bacterium]MCH4065997.1 glycosyltransferase [Lachnospiraceae bacterium]MCH4112032.1 glycosyltransferase [Lachnospiraceae bacterium]
MGETDKQPIRILHVLGTLNLGGAESRTMDLYRHIDRSKVQFDFLVHTEAPGATSEERMQNRAPQFYDEEVRALGGRIYALPRFNGHNYRAYRRAAEQFFSSHHGWVMVQGHMTSMAGVYLPIAKKNGVKVTAVHVRHTQEEHGLRRIGMWVMSRGITKKADELYAVSRLAGEQLYGKKLVENGTVKVIPNAIDAEGCRFIPDAPRTGSFAAPDTEDEIVLGHVGRFDEPKNHAFLLDVFALLPENYRLVMIGGGALQESMKEKARALGIEERCCFAGVKTPAETKRLYSGMDLFVFPSHSEGLPGVVLEAQASGLPCLISANITDEVALSPLVKQLSIDRPGDAKMWADEIGRMKIKDEAGREKDSEEAVRILKDHDFDITEQAKVMEKWYLDRAK